jgi:CHAT domain-containing protein
VTLGQVQAAIPKDGALIEYVRFPYYLGKKRWEFRYGAVLLSSKGDPHWILLGNADDIDAAINQVKTLSARGTDDKEVIAKLRTLYDSVFAPLEQILPAQTLRMIVCPDGQLNFLSFATLLDLQNRFLAENYTVEYVASGRDLLSQIQATANSNVVVFADPDFDLAGSKMTAQIDPPSPSVRGDNFRGGEQRDLTEYTFSPLQGTQQESDELTKKFREWDWQVAAFTGQQATKEALLKQVHSPYILHLATHGFFDREPPANNRLPSNTLLGQVQPNVGTSKFFDNPMHRSGLALAGAQTTLRAWERGETPTRENDGILTAKMSLPLISRAHG